MSRPIATPRSFFIVLFALAFAAAPAFGQTSVTLDDQISSDAEIITISSVTLARDGYVAIHDASLFGPDDQPFTDDDQPLSSVIGVSQYLAAGSYTDLDIDLFDVPGLNAPADTLLPTDQTLIAMPHEETSGNTQYNFLTSGGSEDGPYVDDQGNAIVDPGFVEVGDLVINEVDADQTGTDSEEFLELYNRGPTSTIDLTNYALVFFNGNDSNPTDGAYAAYDLNGTLAAGEFYVLGNVAGADQTFPGPDNQIQNGADAIVLYEGLDASDFDTDGSDASTPSASPFIADAYVYGTSDDTDQVLLDSLDRAMQFDEDADGTKDTESVQRFPDGFLSRTLAPPTPGGDNLPVEFAGAPSYRLDGSDVVLEWTTLSEKNNDGFYVEQRFGSSFRAVSPKIETQAPHGNAVQALTYRYRVEDLEAGAYTFRIRQEDRDGASSHSPAIEVRLSPDGYALSPPTPNPFREKTRVELSVEQPQQVRVSLFNALGRRVRQLYDGPVEQRRTFTLEAGSLAGGVYFYRIEGETFTETGKVVLVR